MNARLHPHDRRGSVLIVAMLITAMLALVLGSYFNLTLTSSKQTRRTFDRNAAFHLTEAGVEEAVWAYNRSLVGAPDAWSEWTTDGAAAWRKFSDFSLTTGSTGTVKVFASDTTPSASSRPVIVAEAAVQTGSAAPATQMIEVTLRRRSFFGNGITALRKLVFRGTQTSFDSWDSDPDHDPATPPMDYTPAIRSDLGGVATGATDSANLYAKHAKIYGFLTTAGALPDVDSGLIGPLGTEPGIIASARVATDFNAVFPTIPSPTDGTWVSPLPATLGVAGETTRWRTDTLTLSGSKTLTILGHVTLIITAPADTTAISITGQASLIIPKGSSLAVYFEGDIRVSGSGNANSLANGNVQPASFILWSTHSTGAGQTIDITGRGELRAVIYAPKGDFTLTGDATMFGAVIARDIVFAGNATFHYDLSLGRLIDHAPYGPQSWRLIISQPERRLLAPLVSR